MRAEDNEQKRVTYIYDDPGLEVWCIAGDREQLARTMWALMEDMEDGEEMVFRFKRHDMTQAEMDAAPEV